MQEIKKVVRQLHPLERKIIPLLKNYNILSDILKNSEMQEAEASRALQWLETKGALKTEQIIEKVVKLTNTGNSYLKDGLPEKRFLGTVKNNILNLDDIKNKARLSNEEVNVCIGILRKLDFIETIKDKKLKIKITDKGINILQNGFTEEDLMIKIKDGAKLNIFDNRQKSVIEDLRKRGIVRLDEYKDLLVHLNNLGKEIVKEKLEINLIENLTPEVLRNKEWKGKEFREYDIKSAVPRIQRGKRHLVDETVNYIKRIWLDLGFKEMEGNIVQTAFWDLDALFVPQDHSARDMQDTFFIGKNRIIEKGRISKELSKKIKETHKNGWTSGSTGHGGEWSEDISRELLLRTHNTVLSAIALSKIKKEDLPVKIFSVGKVYRNEALDWKHLFEFHQSEGIVVDENVNFRNLIWYLKEFFRKMGYQDVKIKPSYFPYTEPSCEIFAYNKSKKEWVEVGGTGIFRPEVTKPLLGFECPVLAWGIGVERIAVNYHGISDLRELYKNDLKQLREAKEML